MSEVQAIHPPAAAPRASVQPTEHFMQLPDGTELFYRAWLPDVLTDKALVLFHRGHEHSGRLEEFVARLGLDDVAVFAWDARGHGRSPGDRGYAPSFATVVQDADCFIRHVCQTYDKRLENTIVLGHSVGGVVAATWVHDYGPPIRAMILATPALRIRLYIPLAIPGLRLLQIIKRGEKAFIKSYVKARMLTHDPQQAQSYAADPLIARAIAVNILLGVHDASSRLLADAGAIQTPTLLLAAGSDWVVSLAAQQRFFDRLSSPIKQMEVFPGFYHSIFHEQNRDRPNAAVCDFIRRAFEPAKSPLLDADKHGYTKQEYDRLARPLPWWQPRRVGFAIQRLLIRTFGRLSEGVSIGLKTGFDSGMTLDYVYENRPRGITPLGRAIDRGYLNSVGWTGIRKRKVHLEKALRSAIEQLHSAGKPVRVLDIATGAGRYVLETLNATRHIESSALLRDYRAANLEKARQLASEMKLTNVAFAERNALDRGSLATVSPRPTIGIVSGLYELIPSNELVLNSLCGLADAIEEGGYLIYTGQPWHPQLEFIARVLGNREGQPWVMRRRTQAEMDALVREAGFRKIGMEIDERGIFTVSVAERRR